MRTLLSDACAREVTNCGAAFVPVRPWCFIVRGSSSSKYSKHKDRLLRATQLPETSLLEALYALVSRLDLVNEANIPIGTWMEAYRLCRDVDEKDTAYVALTLWMYGRLWTEDKELKLALRARCFSSFFEP